MERARRRAAKDQGSDLYGATGIQMLAHANVNEPIKAGVTLGSHCVPIAFP